ncbi:acetyl-CoA carboxylase biotin carboxyl carrier protein [Sporichthya sp.]|uniref:acetyl-CoA carboxylase biotin carboxyl carrier protein n=1 Tax=Sporichthya sp. TaxID=65475 RepID=UPI0017EFA323|nr:acetyl-CoA carboxylase biotin carboxyl carrier protein [Sporichthya sp.]MBA3745608.1 acetyl-CoA carboxylase biotin carboxyl carrier protein [Sporichthya sp.]
MTLSPPDIKAILDALEASDWDSATVTVEGVTIAVARNGATPAGAPAAAPVAPPTPVASERTSAIAPAPSDATPPATPPAAPIAGGHVISAPSVGVFWRSPRPGSPPFVEVGQAVAIGDTICIVEMMKLMNNVVSDVAGTVVAVHVENAAQVEYGAPLITIAPA